jgi:hypothetical protein
METNKPSDRVSERERAKEFVRSILTDDFKQKADDALIEGVADRMLKVLPPRDEQSARAADQP